jgi:hypothetical protein
MSLMRSFRSAAASILTALSAAVLLHASSPAMAQAYAAGSGMLGGAGTIQGSGGAGLIGSPAAEAGLAPTPVIRVPQPEITPAPPPPMGAGYGTPAYGASLGAASNSGVGAGVESDIRSGIGVTPPTR